MQRQEGRDERLGKAPSEKPGADRRDDSLFEDILDTMNEEEMEIAASTPSYRFDAPSQPANTGSVTVPEPTDKAREYVERVIAHPDNPVVLFALEWCEFCWSVRKLFAAAGIPFTSIDLDSVEYQADDSGGEIRAALHKKTARRPFRRYSSVARMWAGVRKRWMPSATGASRTG